MAKGKKKLGLVVADRTKSSHQRTAVSETPPSPSLGVGNREVSMDRRSRSERRSGQDRRTQNKPVPVERRKLQRRAKVPRRRQIDPTTCERDYTTEEIEFMRALDAYKRASGRMFPTCSEILEVLRKLGYEKCLQTTNSVQEDCTDSCATLGVGQPTPEDLATIKEGAD